MNRAACQCCCSPCGSAAYICVINEASEEQLHAEAVAWYCAEQEYSTSDPPDNRNYIHSLVSTTETGLPEYGDTGYALVGLELLVHIAHSGADPSAPPTCHVLNGIEINVTGNTANHSAAIIDEIEERFGDTLVDIDGVSTLNPHPKRIYFIIDDSGSYQMDMFENTYAGIVYHYEHAGMSADDVEGMFGLKKCCGQDNVPQYPSTVMNVTAMVPIESWFAACVGKMKKQIDWTP